MTTVPVTASVPAQATAPIPSLPEAGWPLWRRQLFSVFRLESRKSTLTPRALLLYLLAAMPVVMMGIWNVVAYFNGADVKVGEITEAFSILFQLFYLRGVTFFGCVWVFTNLFRGEMLDQSLHYYFLSPVRRSVLVTGKYLAGLVATSILFGLGVVVTYFLMHLPTGFSAAQAHLLSGQGIGHLWAYVGITLLACVGYGAVFLLFGLLFRNPIVPVAAVLMWEGINFLLPPLLKKISVIHYLNSLMPVPMSEGPFAIVSTPPPAWLSAFGLLVVSGLILGLATLKLKRTEVSYGED